MPQKKGQQKAKIETTLEKMRSGDKPFRECHSVTRLKGNQQVININASTNLLSAPITRALNTPKIACRAPMTPWCSPINLASGPRTSMPKLTEGDCSSNRGPTKLARLWPIETEVVLFGYRGVWFLALQRTCAVPVVGCAVYNQGIEIVDQGFHISSLQPNLSLEAQDTETPPKVGLLGGVGQRSFVDLSGQLLAGQYDPINHFQRGHDRGRRGWRRGWRQPVDVEDLNWLHSRKLT